MLGSAKQVADHNLGVSRFHKGVTEGSLNPGPNQIDQVFPRPDAGAVLSKSIPEAKPEMIRLHSW